MTDMAWQLLRQPLSKLGDGKALWLVDENINEQGIAGIVPTENLYVITNRYDLSQALKHKGFNVALSDYDFSGFDKASFTAIYYRVSKEKAIVHHIINAASEYLSPFGKLHLAGYKNDGIKTYTDKAEKLIGNPADKQRGAKTSLLATMSRADKVAEENRLDNKNYSELATIESGEISFTTKPGLFGWNKIDQGSAFLIDYLSNHLASLGAMPGRVIDLGCGYGYLSVMANQLLPVEYLATDNNITAVTICQQNFDQYKIQGEVLVDNCAASVTKKADLVLCNPPFHQGFDIEGDLTTRFLQAGHRLLNDQGLGLFVVNGFIPLEKKAAALFSSVEVVAKNKSFKVVALRR